MPVSRSQRKRRSCNTESPAMEVNLKMERRSVAIPRPGKKSNSIVNSILPDRALKVKNINTELLKQRETDKEIRPLAKQCAEAERRLHAVESELRKAEDKLRTGARERNALTARVTAADKRCTELQHVNDMLRAKFSEDQLKMEICKLISELAELKPRLERVQQEKEQMKIELEEQTRTLEVNVQTSQTGVEPLNEEVKANWQLDLMDRPLGGGDPGIQAAPLPIPTPQGSAIADPSVGRRLAQRDAEISALRTQVRRVENKLASTSKRKLGRSAVARNISVERDGPSALAGEAAMATVLPPEGPALEQQLSGLIEERASIEQGLRAVLADVDKLQRGDSQLEELVESMGREVWERDEEVDRLRTELESTRGSAEEQRQRLEEQVEALEREVAQGLKKGPPKTPRRHVTLLAAEAGSELARNMESMESKLTQMLCEMTAIQQAYRKQVGDPQPPAGIVTRSQSSEPPSCSSVAKQEFLPKILPLRSAQAQNKLSTEAMQEDIQKWKMMYDKSGSRAFKVASPPLGRLSRLRLTDRRQRNFYPTFVEERINTAGKYANATTAKRCFTGANQLNRQNMFM